MKAGLPCQRCQRPAKLRRLYGRRRDGSGVILIGALGPACFYMVAAQIARSGYQPEHEDARIVHLRGTR